MHNHEDLKFMTIAHIIQEHHDMVPKKNKNSTKQMNPPFFSESSSAVRYIEALVNKDISKTQIKVEVAFIEKNNSKS